MSLRDFLFYEEPGVTLYCGDCRELIPILDGPFAVVTDPPYGIGERTDRHAKGRDKLAECYDFSPVYGDDEPFDPAHILALNVPTVLFGANYYAHRLPPSASWIVWDKRDGIPSNDNADCEVAWTNLGGPARIFRHLWSGMIKASEREDRRVHPTQKPVALMLWAIGRTPSDLMILDPYCGSGTTLEAAKALRRPAIGIEIEPRYCEIAVKRLRQEVLAL